MAISNFDMKIKKRIQLAHIAASELGLLDPKRHNADPDDEYHTILARWNRPGTRQRVTSSTQMSYEQLGELLDFFKALGFKIRKRGAPGGTRDEGRKNLNREGAGDARTSERPGWKKYESSMKGFKEEICDLAKARFGADSWEQHLNNTCIRFGVRKWQWLDVSHGKAVKAFIIRMQREDQRPFATEGTEGTEDGDCPF